MKAPASALQGSDPEETCAAALLLIDVINDLEFPEGKKLFRHALPAARRIARLKRKAKALNIPVIYVNDNFGRWRSDFHRQVDRCMSEPVLGAAIARLLVPAEDDYFVLKPKHSGFYCTTLEVLLARIGARRLIITGFAGNICVACTANDAHMRDFKLWIPSDCVASETADANRGALAHMRRFLGADTRPARTLRYLRQVLGES